MGKTYLVLHKREWERLPRKTDDSNRPNERDEYFRKLIERSQSWIKTWPDTVQGHVELLAKKKEEQHQKDIALVKKGFLRKQKENTKDAINKARKMIFDDSCYGKKLLSALVESKNVEIRDMQIKFQKEIKDLSDKLEKELQSKLKLDQCTFSLDAKEKDIQKKKRDVARELAEINKSMYEMEICKKLKDKEDQKKAAREDAELMAQLLENERQKEKNYEELLKHDIELYERENQLAKKRKADREKRDEAIAQAQRIALEKKYCKINGVIKQIHGDKHDTKQFKTIYNSLEDIKRQEQNRYDGFIQKGVKELEDKTVKKELEEATKRSCELKTRMMLAKSNNLAGQEAAQLRQAEKHFNKCVGDRQCILTKSCEKRNVTRMENKNDKHQPSFLTVSSKLQDDLTKRKAQATPWNALSTAHAHFAERARDTLGECRHKRFARKVVDEYRKLNCLDESTLPVSNY